MTTREEWLALAARCEAATGPDRELDGLIFMALRNDHPAHWKVLPETGQIYAWNRKPPHAPGTGGVWAKSPRYTASIDAAASAVERGFPGGSWRCGIISREHEDGDAGQEGGWARVFLNCGDERDEMEFIVSGRPNAALALMAALCRAKAEDSK